jgi:hypothetical protein
MIRGWEFYWEGKRYCVGAPDAPTARRFLRAQHPEVAQRARVPMELALVVVLDLKLKQGRVRVMNVIP